MTEKPTGKELAKTIEQTLNRFSFESTIQECIEEMAYVHPTLQQCFTGLCLAWLRHMAQTRRVDGRNEASAEVAKKIVAVIGPDGALPFI